MPITPKDAADLRRLEESTWIAETRRDKAYLDRLFAPGFFEIGPGGKRYTRQEIIDLLPAQDVSIRLPLREFEVHPLSEDVVLVTYLSEIQVQELRVAKRSSIWIRGPEGWQMLFHQGTSVQ